MCDPGEEVSLTLKREFMEEASNILQKSGDESYRIKETVDRIFSNGALIYKGYIDDPRNTDNAWMESVCVNFLDETGELLADFKLEAGDDAKNVRWIDIDSSLRLYADHEIFIENVAEMREAHSKLALQLSGIQENFLKDCILSDKL